MTAIPVTDCPITALIDTALTAEVEAPRPHLGVSGLGHHCERWIWLSFRWAVRERHDGRTLRIFQRGKDEETRAYALLAKAGINIVGTQDRVDFGSHVSGSLDGRINTGVPQAPFKPHVFELKTHNKKSFDALVNDGLEKSNPMHYAQCQVYMRGKKIDRALYMAVCKDDDRLHFERVRLDIPYADKLIAKGKRLALEARPPAPISTDPTWYQCKMCAGHDFCHESKMTKEVNCRTCAHSTPMPDSTWKCERHDADDIPVEYQRTGCDDHVLHPDLVPWPINEEHSTDTRAAYEIDGIIVANGHPDRGVFTSAEIIANPIACAHNQAEIGDAKRQWPGLRVSG